MATVNVTEAAVAAKNHIYDGAATDLWRTLVYEPVHAGWTFANIGGAPALDAIARMSVLGHDMRVLELCCGTGDTCCYLAERTGATIVGVDINAKQIAAGRRRLIARPPACGRVELVHADVREFDDGKPFDLVYAMDSLVLVPDLASMLRHARRLVRPGGALAAAEVIAGKRLTPKFRQYVWDEDGFINLVTADEYLALMEATGFHGVTLEPHSDDAARCFTTIYREARRRRDDVTAAGGSRAYDEWRRLSSIYARAFREGWLSYVWLHATRPAYDACAVN